MFVYRLVAALVVPLLAVRFLWRRLRGAEPAGALAERLARGATPTPASRIWIHGASNGEIASARWLIEAVLAQNASQRILVTSNTVTARDMVRGWSLERVDAVLAPLDSRSVLRRFLARWKPSALVILENEMWPNRMAMARARGLPVMVLAARMSEGSARRWAARPRMVETCLGAITFLSAQDSESEVRFRALGLAPDRIGPLLNLKTRAQTRRPKGLCPDELGELQTAFPRTQTLLAASTHAGEEEKIVWAFREARRANPGLRLILAPRHPRRRDEILARIDGMGLSRRVRSMGQLPDAETAVYLADTMGEMGLWYDLAGMTFVGGSLVPVGGHTPFEPAQHGSAILHGPHVANHRPAYSALSLAGAAVEVRDAPALARALAEMADPVRQATLAEAATEALAEHSSADGAEAVLGAIFDMGDAEPVRA